MVSKEVLKSVLPKPFFNKEIIVRNQTADDIISEVLMSDVLFADQYKIIAHYFDDYDPSQIARNIWNFLKKNIRYVIETDEKQTTCSPAILMSRGTGDCKHYSLFAAGILRALGLPHFFRFASYDLLNKEPGHVYVVMTYDDEPVIIDAVMPVFNQEKTWIYKIDKQPKQMLTRVSGFPQQSVQSLPATSCIHGMDDNARVGSIFSRFAKWTGKEVKQAAKFRDQEAKKIAKGALSVVKYAGKMIIKVASIPSRNAFLLLINFNALGLAISLFNGAKKNPKKIQNFWEAIGGDWGHLKTAINNGVKNKLKGQRLSGIGNPAAALAVATPIIVAVVALLKQLGIGNPAAEKAASKGIQALTEQAEKAGTGFNPFGSAPNISDTTPPNDITETSLPPNNAFTAPDTTSTGGGSNTGLLLAGGALLLIVAHHHKAK
jgi:hypothetical protein